MVYIFVAVRRPHTETAAPRQASCEGLMTADPPRRGPQALCV